MAREGNTINRARICVNILVFTDLMRIGYNDSTSSLYKTAKLGFGAIIPI
jgi:hypothetical protein